MPLLLAGLVGLGAGFFVGTETTKIIKWAAIGGTVFAAYKLLR